MGETFADRLKRAQADARMSNVALGRAVKRTDVTVSEWRSGRQMPDDETLRSVAKVLGVSEVWLRYGQEAAPATNGLAPRTGGMSEYARGVLHAIRTMNQTLAVLAGEVLESEAGPPASASPYPPAEGAPLEYFTSTEEPSPYAKQQAEEAAKRARKRRA